MHKRCHEFDGSCGICGVSCMTGLVGVQSIMAFTGFMGSAGFSVFYLFCPSAGSFTVKENGDGSSGELNALFAFKEKIRSCGVFLLWGERIYVRAKNE